MLSSIDISTSALVAQRTRLDAISGNIANMSTQRNEEGEITPYQARTWNSRPTIRCVCPAARPA